MGIYRTYFDKNNTIVKGSLVNTGRNPISELYFGTKTSRFLFYCSFQELIDKIDSGDIIFGEGTTHTLRIKNTSNFDIEPYLNLNQNLVLGDTYLPVGFNVDLHLVSEYWVEGFGYDYNKTDDPYIFNAVFNETPSNWTERTLTDDFTYPGSIDLNGENMIASVTINKGNDDIVINITSIVNAIIQGEMPYYQGFCLKFSPQYEDGEYPKDVSYGIGLYTKYTSTFFQPFIETEYYDVISDDRANAFVGKTNRLYMYSIINGRYANLDQAPTVTIGDVELTANLSKKGHYYVDVDSSTLESYTEYTDVWSNLFYSQQQLPDRRFKFVLKDQHEYYNLTDTIGNKSDYGVTTSGIRRGEKIAIGNTKLITTFVKKAYTVGENILTDNIEYNLYIKQGDKRIRVFDWQQMDRIHNKHQFKIDTSFLIPQRYYADIKLNIGGETLLFNEMLDFEIVSNT